MYALHIIVMQALREIPRREEYSSIIRAVFSGQENAIVVLVFMLFLPFFTGEVFRYADIEKLTIAVTIDDLIKDAETAADFIASH